MIPSEQLKPTHLCYILKHSHSGYLFLNGTIVVDLVPKLGPVSRMVDLYEIKQNENKYKILNILKAILLKAIV